MRQFEKPVLRLRLKLSAKFQIKHFTVGSAVMAGRQFGRIMVFEIERCAGDVLFISGRRFHDPVRFTDMSATPGKLPSIEPSAVLPQKETPNSVVMATLVSMAGSRNFMASRSRSSFACSFRNCRTGREVMPEEVETARGCFTVPPRQRSPDHARQRDGIPDGQRFIQQFLKFR